MTHHDGKIAGYRPAVGIMLLNRLGQVLVARRTDMPAMPAWQMPQGGIDPGETPRQAALRELAEEIGTCNAEIIAESREWMVYDLPVELARSSVEWALSRPAAKMVRYALCRQRRGYRRRDQTSRI